MPQRRSLLRLLFVLLAVVALAPLTPASAREVPRARERHCVVVVVGQSADGELRTSEPVCHDQRPLATTRASVLAVHYEHHGFNGSSYTVAGSACTGGWLNLPASWTDRISSTSSHCRADHFDHHHLAGTMQTTPSPGADLTTLDNRTNSIRYR